MVPARAAALVNGAASHALDYDDTHFGHIGHPSVAIYPAVLAVGEAKNAAASDVVDAFLIGIEASVRLGMVLGAARYNWGFHLDDGTVRPFADDLAAAQPLAVQEIALRRKATALIGAEVQTLWQAIDAVAGLSARDLGHLLRAT